MIGFQYQDSEFINENQHQYILNLNDEITFNLDQNQKNVYQKINNSNENNNQFHHLEINSSQSTDKLPYAMKQIYQQESGSLIDIMIQNFEQDKSFELIQENYQQIMNLLNEQESADLEFYDQRSQNNFNSNLFTTNYVPQNVIYATQIVQNEEKKQYQANNVIYNNKQQLPIQQQSIDQNQITSFSNFWDNNQSQCNLEPVDLNFPYQNSNQNCFDSQKFNLNEMQPNMVSSTQREQIEKNISIKLRNTCKFCQKTYTNYSGLINHTNIKHPKLKTRDCAAEICLKKGRPNGSKNKIKEKSKNQEDQKKKKNISAQKEDLYYQKIKESGKQEIKRIDKNNGNSTTTCKICKIQYANKGVLMNHGKSKHKGLKKSEYALEIATKQGRPRQQTINIENNLFF